MRLITFALEILIFFILLRLFFPELSETVSHVLETVLDLIQDLLDTLTATVSSSTRSF